MGTITINVDDEIEKRFRKNVQLKYGKTKGALGQAITQALKKWNLEQADLEFTMQLLNENIDRGGYTYQDRGELHVRN